VFFLFPSFQNGEVIWDQINSYGADLADTKAAYDRLHTEGVRVNFLKNPQVFLR